MILYTCIVSCYVHWTCEITNRVISQVYVIRSGSIFNPLHYPLVSIPFGLYCQQNHEVVHNLPSVVTNCTVPHDSGMV
jgi:hypothetical protein